MIVAVVIRKPTTRKQTGKARKTKTRRDTLIAKVKIAQKQLGLFDSDYRCLLSANYGVSSCTALEERDLVRLISYFRSKGWKDAPSRKKAVDRHGKPKNLKSVSHPAAPVLQRIEAILSEIGKARGTYIPWDYAAGILAKHTGLTHLDTATVGELQKVMVALERTLKTEQRKRA